MDYAKAALEYAENNGIYEYQVNGRYIEFWNFYSDGWYFVRYDLVDKAEVFRGAHIPLIFDKNGYISIPAFLKTPSGAVKYNYMA